MTLDTTLSKAQYQGNGLTTVFPVPFKVLEDDHLYLMLTGASGPGALVDRGRYRLERNGEGLNVVYPLSGPPMAKGQKLTIYRRLPLDQVVDLINAGAFHPRVIEEQGLDREEMQIQQLAEELGRTIKYPIDYDGQILSADEYITELGELKDKARAEADRSCDCADAACACAKRAEAAAANVDDSVIINGGTSNLQDTWTTTAAIASGGTLALPVGYFPARNILRLTMDGLTCYPKGPNVPAALPQYEEIGAVGKMSREVKLLFAAPAGAVWNAWVIASNTGAMEEEFIDRAEAARDAAQAEADRSRTEANRSKTEADRSKAEADRSKTEADRSKAEVDRSKAEADRAEAAADRVESTVDLTQGVNNIRSTWKTTSALNSGGNLTLPINYIVGRNVLMLTVDGIVCHPSGSTTDASLPQYTEAGASETISSTVKLLFDVPAGAVWSAWVVASNVSYLVSDFTKRAEAAAVLAEECKVDSCDCATDARASKLAAANSAMAATVAANSITDPDSEFHVTIESLVNRAEDAAHGSEQAQTKADTAAKAAEAAQTAAASSQTAAANSATSAATNAANAANSASGAATSATNAATSATNAANSATSAGASATTATTAKTDAQKAATDAAASAAEAYSSVASLGVTAITAAAPLTSGKDGTILTVGLNTVPVTNGGTGATAAAAARTNLGVAYGTTAGTVAQGNDSRLLDARTPTAHKATHATGGTDALAPADIGAAAEVHTTPVATAAATGHVKPGTGLSVGTDGALTVSYGTAAGTACEGNDSRLSNVRTPAAHASTHNSGGSDALTFPVTSVNVKTGAVVLTGADVNSTLTDAAGANTLPATTATSTQSLLQTVRNCLKWLIAQFPLSIANGGTGLTAAPSMLTNLATTTAASPLAASPRPGVTGTLPVANGGTGLTAANSVLTNLASTSGASILAASPRPGVTGVLPIANGGTGTTTGLAAAGAPMPQTASGVGQWTTVAKTTTGADKNITLPSGGTWAYCFLIDVTDYDPVRVAGVAAGGTIVGSIRTVSSGTAWPVFGFCYRIA